MTTVSFLGGVGVIGSSKILVEQDGWRVLLDLGLDIPSGRALLRHPARPHAGRELADRLRLGEAPRLDHVYRAGPVGAAQLATGADGRTAVFVSHDHLDHDGLAGWVDPAVGVHVSPGTGRMLAAQGAAGAVPEGGEPPLITLDDGASVAVGPLQVQLLPVDHDVDGASGFLVRTDAGVLAYTGDIRRHGRRPELTDAFAAAARGADFLVVDCTGLSTDLRTEFRTEAGADAAFAAALDRTPGLALITLYPRNVERVAAFTRIAEDRGRSLVWPDGLARFLRAYGVPDVRSYDEVGPAEIARAPHRYVVQLQPDRLADLLDLPAGPGAMFLHANGEPLGPFDPAWKLMREWLEFCAVPFQAIGSSGHCSPQDLHGLVADIAPRVVFPLHTSEPYRLVPPPGTLRVLPERGRTYRLEVLLAGYLTAPVAVDGAP